MRDVFWGLSALHFAAVDAIKSHSAFSLFSLVHHSFNPIIAQWFIDARSYELSRVLRTICELQSDRLLTGEFDDNERIRAGIPLCISF